jgi:signal transduction histidine kinase
MTTTTSPGTIAPSVTVPADRRLIRQLWVDTLYTLVGLPLGIITFTLAVTGFSLGVGTLVLVFIGLPVLAGTLFAARGFAHLERIRIRSVIRRPAAPVGYKTAPPGAGFFRRMLTPLTDLQSWLDLLHAVVRFPVSVVAFVFTVTWWAIALAGITWPLYGWAIPNGPDDQDLPELLGLGSTYSTKVWFYALMGVAAALTVPLVVRGAALTEAWIAKGMLDGMAEVRRQIRDLTEERTTARQQTAAAQIAEATALRRLERDLHDGPQQRLVRLAVDLSRARHQMQTDPSAAEATVTEAAAQAREALDELRTLSRGFAPPILTDRGLAAALAALAARCTVPVSLDLPAMPRLDPLAEQTAYFVAAESLANVAKHSGATVARIAVALHRAGEAERLRVTVTDDGAGGAHVAKGHGLAGLADRVRAAGGELTVDSPAGGPTQIRAELPCASNPGTAYRS